MATQNPYSDSLLMDAFRGSLSNAESLGRGFAVAPVGLMGDINALAREYITPRLPSRVQGLLQAAPAAPTTEQILSNIPRASAPRMETSGMEQLGAAMNPRGPVDLARGVERAAMAAGRAGERYAERVVPQIMERGGMPAQLLGDLSQGSIRPMDVYHGSTNKELTQLNPKKSFGNLGVSWVSPEEEFAKRYAGKEGRVYKLDLNEGKNFDFANQEQLDLLKEKAKSIDIYDPIRGSMTLDKRVPDSGSYYSAEDPQLFNLIKKMGFDSVSVYEDGVRNIGVFNPKKNIKFIDESSAEGLLGQQAKSAPSDLSYRGSHTAPSPEFGAPLYDLTGGGQMYPADVYSPKAAQYYGTGYAKADKEAFALANKVRGNPDAEVTMYRAVPKDASISNINAGDWVTLSKDYAKNHGESVLGNDYKILSQKVKAKDLWTNADSIHEFGYQPQAQSSTSLLD